MLSLSVLFNAKVAIFGTTTLNFKKSHFHLLIGSTEKLEIETSKMTFLDAVLAPPITTGVGESNTTIFVDTNHTKVWNMY